MIHLNLKTVPISVNKLYRGRRFLTHEGERIKRDIAIEIRKQWKGKPTENEVAVHVGFYFKNKRMLDLDNGLKALFDAMTGIVWVDDKQVVTLIAMKKVDAKNPRIELRVLEVLTSNK